MKYNREIALRLQQEFESQLEYEKEKKKKICLEETTPL